MTTPAGVPNLPIGALTVETLAEKLQDHTQEAMRARAGAQMPDIFANSTGGDILEDLSPFGIIAAIWSGVNSLIATADPEDIQGPEDLPPLMLDFIEGLPLIGQFVLLLEALNGTYDGTDTTLIAVQDLVAPILQFFTDLTTEFGTLADWLTSLIAPALSAALQAIDAFFTDIPSIDLDAWLAALKTLIDGLLGITSFEDWIAVFKEAVDFLFGLGGAAVTALLEFVGWLWTGVAGGFAGFGPTVETLLKPLLAWLSTANLQALDGGIVNTLWSLLNGGAEGIGRTLAEVLTSIGDFVGGLIPAITGTAGDISIGDITTWAEALLTKGLTWPDFKQIFGEIPESILGVLPVANINLINPELMAQGGFDTTVTLTAGTGWAWDGTTTNSGSGGSAKVTGNGTARSLYSNQSIAVAPGDKLYVSCYVKSTGTVGAAAITLSVVEFSGTTVAGSQSAGAAIASRAGSSTFVQIGATSAVGTVYTVPAGVTSIRVKVAVTSGAAAGSFVWFDDISVKKTGLLSGAWMGGILGTVVQDFQQIVDALAQAIKGVGTAGSGNALTSILTNVQTIFATLFNTLALPTSLISNPLLEAAIPGIQASKITSGSFGTDRITDDAVTTAKIGPLAVTSAELGTDAVTNAKIGAGAVGTTEIASLAVTTALINTDAVTNAKIGPNAVGTTEIATDAVTANEIASGTITTTEFAAGTIGSIGTSLGTAITTGSGGKMSRTNTATKVTAAAGDNKFSVFFVNPAGSIVEQRSADITTPVNGRFTVTHAGYYIVELGFTVNASTPAAGYFNVAPAIFLNGSATPSKVGADSLGSFGYIVAAPVGNYSRTAHSTFIVYLGAAGYVEAGYRNFGVSNANFFQGDTDSNSTFFSIAMLNRTAEG